MVWHGTINGHHAAYLLAPQPLAALSQLIAVAREAGAQDEDVLELRLLWSADGVPQYIRYNRRNDEANEG